MDVFSRSYLSPMLKYTCTGIEWTREIEVRTLNGTSADRVVKRHFALLYLYTRLEQ